MSLPDGIMNEGYILQTRAAMSNEKTTLLSDERLKEMSAARHVPESDNPGSKWACDGLAASELEATIAVRDLYEADRASLLSVVRELATALAYATEGMNCDDWGEVDLNGEGATAPYAHDIVAMPGGCQKCKANDLLSKIKSTYNIEP